LMELLGLAGSHGAMEVLQCVSSARNTIFGTFPPFSAEPQRGCNTTIVLVFVLGGLGGLEVVVDLKIG